MSAGGDTAPLGFVVSSDKREQRKEHTFPGSGQSLTGRAVVSRSLNASWGGREGEREGGGQKNVIHGDAEHVEGRQHVRALTEDNHP